MQIFLLVHTAHCLSTITFSYPFQFLDAGILPKNFTNPLLATSYFTPKKETTYFKRPRIPQHPGVMTNSALRRSGGSTLAKVYSEMLFWCLWFPKKCHTAKMSLGT